MPSRRMLIALAAVAAAVLVIVAVVYSPNNNRGDGFKSEAAEGVATGGATDKKAP
jgi:hypothetical protein